MATTVIHTCDICKSSKSKEDLCHFEVCTRGIKIKYSSYNKLEFDVCKSCLEKKGFIVDNNNDEEDNIKNKNALTLEDKIYDILQDIGVAFTE